MEIIGDLTPVSFIIVVILITALCITIFALFISMVKQRKIYADFAEWIKESDKKLNELQGE